MTQVKELLSDLIAKLEKEAAEAANLHEFARKKKTAEAMEQKAMTLAKLDARLDKASAKKTELEEDIATLSGAGQEILRMLAIK